MSVYVCVCVCVCVGGGGGGGITAPVVQSEIQQLAVSLTGLSKVLTEYSVG